MKRSMLVVTFVLSGCDFGDPVMWVKDGATEVEQRKDDAECTRSHRAQTQWYSNCMAERGYTMLFGGEVYAYEKRRSALKDKQQNPN